MPQKSAKPAQASAATAKLELVSIDVANFKSFSGAANSTQSEEQAARASNRDQQEIYKPPAHIVGPFTQFTGIIGPNGVGKSNIFDAIAFALNLSLAPGKIRHARDLAHRLKQIDGEQPLEPASAQQNEFSVQLRFLKTDLDGKVTKLLIRRGLRRRSGDDSADGPLFGEWVVAEGDRDAADHDLVHEDLIYEEYKERLTSCWNLDIQEFALY